MNQINKKKASIINFHCSLYEIGAYLDKHRADILAPVNVFLDQLCKIE